jgi:hypothetical protein
LLITYRESLRDIEACLRAQQPKLYPMGFRGQVFRNTLAPANEHRDWRIYADFAQVLIAAARDLYCGASLPPITSGLISKSIRPKNLSMMCLGIQDSSMQPHRRQEWYLDDRNAHRSLVDENVLRTNSVWNLTARE